MKTKQLIWVNLYRNLGGGWTKQEIMCIQNDEVNTQEGAKGIEVEQHAGCSVVN